MLPPLSAWQISTRPPRSSWPSGPTRAPRRKWQRWKRCKYPLFGNCYFLYNFYCLTHFCQDMTSFVFAFLSFHCSVHLQGLPGSPGSPGTTVSTNWAIHELNTCCSEEGFVLPPCSIIHTVSKHICSRGVTHDDILWFQVIVVGSVLPLGLLGVLLITSLHP